MSIFTNIKDEVFRKAPKIKNETASFVLLESGLAEQVYDPETDKSSFAVIDKTDNKVRYQPFVRSKTGKRVFPIPETSSIIKNSIVLFPSKAEIYSSEKKLLQEIQAFIHRYLEVGPIFEKIGSHYVLFSWLYDNFQELPYLRLLGDYGTGKSRGLRVLGSIAYKPIFAGGSTSPSPIFRLLNNVAGTFILDEADFKVSETYADIIKILNCGFQKGIPVLRSEGSSGKKFEVKSFNVFGPKIISTREPFKDLALESRCLTHNTEEMLRKDIPYNLPNSFDEEALHIRNKLLLWRLANWGEKQIEPSLADRSVAPRLNQILLPLLAIVKDKDIQRDIRGFIRGYNQELREDRGSLFEAEVLEELVKILRNPETEASVKNITNAMNERYGKNEVSFKGKKFHPNTIGNILRKKLRIRPERIGISGNYAINKVKYRERIGQLMDKYNVPRSFEDKTDAELQKEAENLLTEATEPPEPILGGREK